MVKKSDIYKVGGTFPVKVYVDHGGEKEMHECLQSFSMTYNQLFRDCSCSPYGDYFKDKDNKDNNNVKLNSQNLDEDFL